MHIGEVAEKTGLSLRTLRHYDDVGLLKVSARTEGGFRVYTAEDVSRLLLIRRMKPLGFTLEEMAELLDVVDELATSDADAIDAPAVRERLARFIDEVEQRREKLRQNLAYADEFLALLTRQ